MGKILHEKNKRQKLPPLPQSILGIIFLLGVGFSVGYFASEERTIQLNPESDTIRICFSPDESCENLILKGIESAKETILVQSYAFTSKHIADALINAKKSGIEVAILTDKSQFQEKYSQIPYLKRKGIPIQIDNTEGLAHNKIIIPDNENLFTGSYNFTRAANTRNAENLLFIQSKEIANIYTKEWYKRSQPKN